jgi:aminoglycoside 6'-N-acetyltransferase I
VTPGPQEAGGVRTATVADLAAVERVEQAAERSVQIESVRAAILDPERVVLVAVVDGEVVGWAKTHLYPDADGPAPAGHYLGGVTVAPEHRRQGVGAALTAARLAWLAPRTAVVHYLVNAANTASIELHRRWGFREVARGRAFHRVPFAGGAGLLMAADLSPAVSAAGAPRSPG